MKKQITENDIVKYVYKEVTTKEKAAIERALFGNQLLEDEFYSMVDLKQQMDELEKTVKPSRKSIDRILKFSRSFNAAVEKS